MSAALGLLALLAGSSVAFAVPPLKTAAASVAAAERYRRTAAKRFGLRKAFSATAASNATIFIPDPFAVTEWLTKDDRYWNPVIAGRWTPDTIILSCDGHTALTIGKWRHDDDHGYYATVWVRTRRGWRWSYHFDDREDEGSAKLSRAPTFQRASCIKADPSLLPPHTSDIDWDERHSSADHSLEWALWNIVSHYHLAVYEWDGGGYKTVIHKEIAHDYE